MARTATKSGGKQSFESLGRQARRLGDLALAERYLAEACRRAPRDGALRLELADILAERGNAGDALHMYSRGLALKRDDAGAAGRMAALAARYRLDDPSDLDPAGLAAALRHPSADAEALAETALAFLRRTTQLGSAVRRCVDVDPEFIPASYIDKQTAPLLADPLLLAALAAGINVDPELEQLLIRFRRVILLALAPARFADRALTAFVIALVQQCQNNGHVWPVTDDERAALAAFDLDFARLAAGDLDAAIGCLRALLYAPPEQVLGPAATASGVRGVRPQALRGLLAEHLAAREREAALAVGMARLGDIRDATSLAVQGQYEAAPYPRWRSIARPDSDAMRQRLGDHVASARLAFMARPFRVLVAGCGTGQHAALATLGYGRDATITALDLSRASLAYGQRMCEALRVPPARFVQGDILDCGLLDGPFDIIESVGVLHHMADPFAGWRALLGCLAPGGLMLIGLYSARARADIATRRSEPDYPGADCDDDAARAYRARLMAREQAAGVRALTRSRDFYALAAFRDLLLHRSERRMTIGEIGAFLAAEGLVFRGFAVTPETRAAFEQAFPHATWPGRLETWDAFEVAHPSTFEGMYQFWCERKDPP